MNTFHEKCNNFLERLGLPPSRVLFTILTTSSLSVFSTYYFSIVNTAEDVYQDFLFSALGRTSASSSIIPNG